MPRAKKNPTAPGMTNPSSPANPLPAAPTGLPYGENKALTTSQQQVPQGSTPMPAPTSPASPTGPQAPGAPPQDRFAAMLGAAQQFTPPNLGLGAPTDRPGESVTTPITGPNPVTAGRISATLAQAAQLSGSTSLLELAKRAQALGQ